MCFATKSATEENKVYATHTSKPSKIEQRHGICDENVHNVVLHPHERSEGTMEN